MTINAWINWVDIGRVICDLRLFNWHSCCSCRPCFLLLFLFSFSFLLVAVCSLMNIFFSFISKFFKSSIRWHLCLTLFCTNNTQFFRFVRLLVQWIFRESYKSLNKSNICHRIECASTVYEYLFIFLLLCMLWALCVCVSE